MAGISLSDSFIAALRQLYRSRLIKSSEPSVFCRRSAGDFLAGLSGIFRRLLRLPRQARLIVAAGAGNTYIWVFPKQVVQLTLYGVCCCMPFV